MPGGVPGLGAEDFTVLIIHPHLDVVGGSEVLTRILVEELVRRGVVVHLLSRGFHESLRRLSIKLHRLEGCTGDYRRSLRAVDASLASLAEELGSVDAALVMIQEPVYCLLLRAYMPSVPVAMYIHFPVEEELREENLPRFYSMCRFPGRYEHLYWMADTRMVNSFYTARALRRLFGLDAHVVYPAVPWSYYEHEPPGFDERRPRIISVGRFVPQKRLDELVEVVARDVKPRIPDVDLVIVGVRDERYPDYYERLKGLAERYDWVTLIDRPMRPSELAKLYASARVYVHMRIGEHFGMAPVEAMTQGAVPVIPRRTGLAEIIVDGVDGYLYDSRSELVAKIIKALRDKDASRNARRTAYYFTPSRFASNVLGYLKLVASGMQGLGAKGGSSEGPHNPHR